MNTLSLSELKNYLKEYGLHLKYWDPNDGEGHELLGCREILERHYSQLPDSEKNTLILLDRQARQILSGYQGPYSFDIVMLQKTVAIAEKHIGQAA